MSVSYSLFPVRVPFGKVMLPNGQTYDVLMTPEFARALSDLSSTVGTDGGYSPADLAILLKVNNLDALNAFDTAPVPAQQVGIEFDTQTDMVAQVADLRAQVAALQIELSSMASYAALAQQLDDLRIAFSMLEDPGAQVRYMQQLSSAFQNFDSTNSKIVPGIVTGSRAGNAALASALTALANSGLIINSTTP